MASACSVGVYVRFRPVNERERSEGGGASLVTLGAGGTVAVAQPGKPLDFAFDGVYGADTSQSDMYAACARDAIEDVLHGYNRCGRALAARGPLSFSLPPPFRHAARCSRMARRARASRTPCSAPTLVIPRWPASSPARCGTSSPTLPTPTRAKSALRRRRRRGSPLTRRRFTLRVSFLEIYREQVKDLLQPSATNLKVRETPARGVWVEGLTEQYVTTEAEVLECLRQGERARSTSSTLMNDTSSRSHSLFVLTVVQRLPDGSTRTGKLNLADLAGSEKVGKTGATGATLEEAKKINQSLSALGNCINALSSSGGAPTHIPYRDSRLTFILRESLGGNTKTKLIVCASMHPFNTEETVSTLRFAQRAKAIQTRVTVNQRRSVDELEAMVAALTLELERARRYIAQLEQGVDGARLGQLRAQASRAEGSAAADPLDAAAALVAAASSDEAVSELRELATTLEYDLAAARTRERDASAARDGLMAQLDEARQQQEKDRYEAAQAALALQAAQLAAETAGARAALLAEQGRTRADELEVLRAELDEARSTRQQLQARAREQEAALSAAQGAAARAAQALAERDVALAQAQGAAAAAASERDALAGALGDQTARADLLQGALAAADANTDAERAELRAAHVALQQVAQRDARELAAARERLAALEVEHEALRAASAQAAAAAARAAQESGAQADELRAQLHLAQAASNTAAESHARALQTARERLQLARRDLDETQGKYLLALRQNEQRNARIHALELELARRTEVVRELKDDIEAAVQLNVDNAAKYQEELQAMELRHRRAAETRKATIVRSIVASPKRAAGGASVVSASSASPPTQSPGSTTSTLAASPRPAEPGEYSASGWFALKLASAAELGAPKRAGWLHVRATGLMAKGWRRRWCVLPHGQCCLYFFDAQPEPDERAKACIEFGSAAAVKAAPDVPDAGPLAVLQLTLTGGKQVQLGAEGAVERDAWVLVVGDAVE